MDFYEVGDWVTLAENKIIHMGVPKRFLKIPLKIYKKSYGTLYYLITLDGEIVITKSKKKSAFYINELSPVTPKDVARWKLRSK